MPKDTGRNSKNNAPTTSTKHSVAAIYPPGPERCWCQGFGKGCGRPRSPRARKYHAAKEKEIRESTYDKLTRHICKRSLTLQFVEILALRQGNFPRASVDNLNNGEYQNIPGDPQDIAPMDNADPVPVREDQPHNPTMESQDHDTSYFDFDFGLSFSPGPEPGPSHASRDHQVFAVQPDSEPESEEESDAELEQDDYTRVYFEPDVGSEPEDTDEDDEEQQDPRLAQGEEARQLNIQRQLDDLGTYSICPLQ